MKINIFTIVYNGMPWLEKVYESIPHDARWSIVHGLADPVADTSWCRHLEQYPDDGTLAFLDLLEATDARVIVNRQDRWPGKTAMCNAALSAFDEPGVLVQMDADEVWTRAQVERLPALFGEHPECDSAQFICNYYLGPNRISTVPGSYGNRVSYEWIRAWRFIPGATFATHEPPQLAGGNGRMIPWQHTLGEGFLFNHYAYATREQMQFKALYYGNNYSVDAWEKLAVMRGEVFADEVLPWIHDPCFTREVTP